MPFGFSINLADLAGLFLFLAGFVLGLGAVTVIDIHGFLGRKSSYWTETTTRAHKVTKPLIWAGIMLAIIGGVIFYRSETLAGIPLFHAIIAAALVANGYFLSFKVSPFLLQREREGKSGELLSQSWQSKIMASMLLSAIGWWGGLVLLAVYLLNR